MEEKYQKGISLIEGGNYQEAYDFFEELYQKDQYDYLSLYYMTTLEFLYLAYDIDESIENLKYLLKVYPRAKEALNVYLSMAYDAKGESEEAINYAKRALKFENTPQIELNLCIARNLFIMGGESNYQEALEYINKCIELDDNQTIDLLFQKADILIELKRYDELNKLLDDVMIKYNNNPGVYFYHARALYEQAMAGDSPEGFQKALEAYQAYQKLEPDDNSILLNLYLIYKNLGEYDQALAELTKIEELSDEENKPLMLSEKMYLLSLANKEEAAFQLANEALVKYPNNAIIYQAIGKIKAKDFNNKVDVNEALEYLEKACEYDQNEETLEDLAVANRTLGKYSKNLEILTEFLKDYPLSGYAWHLLSITYKDLNYDYDHIEKAIIEASKCQYYDYVSYLEMILPVTKSPHVYQKQVKYLVENINIKNLQTWLKREVGIWALYGFNLSKTYPEKAYEYLNACLLDEPNLTCAIVAMGRYYELTGDAKKAFTCYQKAYDLADNKQSSTSCNCPIGYLAHAYLQGIGTNKDLSKAKQMIVDAIAYFQTDASGTIIYLYAYLYLLGEVNVAGEEVLKLLNNSNSFRRYEITKEVLEIQILTKLNLDASKQKKMLKKALKYDCLKAQEHYQIQKKQDVFYPFLNNY